MGLGKRIRLQISDSLGPAGNRWAEIARVSVSQVRCGWAGFPRECNICGYEGRFFPSGLPWGLTLRLDAGCPQCRSQERHRLVKLWLDGNRDAIAGRSVLHFAPERALQRFIEPLAATYLTADIDPDLRTSRRIDIEDADLDDSSFEVVVCSHVLEHVDDAKALREIHRILTPDGIALLMVPFVSAWPATYENPGVTGHRERLLHFGQFDHVRFYGDDFASRVMAAGFAVERFVATEPAVSQHSLERGDTLFIARRA